MPIIDGCVFLGRDREIDLSPEALIEQMDACGVEAALVMPLDRACAVDCREGNESMLRTCLRFPQRLIPTCTANPWYAERASEEVRRAAGAGAQVLVLHPSVQGFNLNDELADPLCCMAEELALVVYAHTGCPQQGAPLQLAELALRWPRVRFIMGHCGATDFWPDVPEACRLATNIYLESSMARPSIFASHLERVGHDRGIAGSGAPLNDLALEWRSLKEAIPPQHWGRVAGGTLASLLAGRGG